MKNILTIIFTLFVLTSFGQIIDWQKVNFADDPYWRNDTTLIYGYSSNKWNCYDSVSVTFHYIKPSRVDMDTSIPRRDINDGKVLLPWRPSIVEHIWRNRFRAN